MVNRRGLMSIPPTISQIRAMYQRIGTGKTAKETYAVAIMALKSSHRLIFGRTNWMIIAKQSVLWVVRVDYLTIS